MDHYAPLRTVGAQIMMTSPNHMGDRLDMLERELHRLKAMRSQEESFAYPPGPNLPDRLPPLSLTGSSHMQQMPTMPVPMPMPMHMPMHQPPANDGPSAQEHQELLSAHRELLETMRKQQQRHTELLQSHGELMKAHTDLLKQQLSKDGAPAAKKKAKKHPSLGIVRLDYNYPPAAGDTDCPASYGFDVYFRAVPGLTFEICQAGRFGEQVERRFAEAIKYLEQRGCSAITGDCGFMMAFQVLARKIATKPVFMSAMVQCPVIAAAFEPADMILVLTANELSLRPQKEVLLNSCGFDVNEDRFILKGCEHVPGFDAVAKGEKVPLDIVQPGVVKLTKQILKENKAIKAILLECTELPPYADALRASTGLPVWDAITGADFYMSAYKDNPRYGLNDWQEEWDQEQEEYSFGDNLIAKDKELLLNYKPEEEKAKQKKAAKAKAKACAKTKAKLEKTAKQLSRKQHPILGIVRLDYNYPPAPGDIDAPASYGYDILFRVVPGFTFAMCMSGRMSHPVQQEFVKAVKWLEGKGASMITGDCGFMMAFQSIASEVANVPVFMSAMVQSPMISVAFDKYDKILILTADSTTLKPQKDVLLNRCGFDVDDTRFVIYGCEKVPGFDAVAKGEKVDVDYVMPGIVKMTEDILKMEPTIRAILLECTELPPYADALRQATDLPVFDAITCCDFFMSARKDNPRFGLNQWQNDWDGEQEEYEFGANLTAEQRAKLVNG